MVDSNFAWILLQHPLELNDPQISSWISEKEVAQLHGLFLFLSCGSDFLTESQAENGIGMLGLSSVKSVKVENAETVESSVTFDRFLLRVKEILLNKKYLERDLRTLFSFHRHDGESDAFISRKSLRHLLVDVESPYKLTVSSYAIFEKSLSLTDLQEIIPINYLIRKMLFSFH